MQDNILVSVMWSISSISFLADQFIFKICLKVMSYTFNIITLDGSCPMSVLLVGQTEQENLRFMLVSGRMLREFLPHFLTFCPNDYLIN